MNLAKATVCVHVRKIAAYIPWAIQAEDESSCSVAECCEAVTSRSSTTNVRTSGPDNLQWFIYTQHSMVHAL